MLILKGYRVSFIYLFIFVMERSSAAVTHDKGHVVLADVQ